MFILLSLWMQLEDEKKNNKQNNYFSIKFTLLKRRLIFIFFRVQHYNIELNLIISLLLMFYLSIFWSTFDLSVESTCLRRISIPYFRSQIPIQPAFFCISSPPANQSHWVYIVY